MTLTQISSRGVEDTLRWSLGASGTSHYTFTGPGLTGTVNDPTIYLTRGHTYVFENNSGGHPFYIKTSIANGGTNDAYNTGVTNNGGGNGTEIKFVVPHDSPDILYYQCSSHASMAGQFNIAGSVADGSITTAKLANDAVDSTKIADGAINSSNLFSGAVVNTAQIVNNAVTTNEIADDAVTTDKIGNNAVSSGQINDNAVGSNQITSDAVVTSKIASGAVTTARLADESVNEAKLQVSNSPTNGYFLSAQSGNTGGLTWAQVAQPDLTNLSASNLTSGTIPDARFPSTLPAAVASNLTNLAAANLTGALPAIDGSSLTGIASNCTGCKVAIQSGEYGSMHNSAVQVPGTLVTFTNTVAEHKYMVLCGYTVKSRGTQGGYRVETYLSGGNNMRWVHGNSPTGTSYTSMQSTSYTTYGAFFGVDYGSGTGQKDFSIYCRAYNNNGNSKIKDSYVMVFQFITS